jgi:hypothetical protein
MTELASPQYEVNIPFSNTRVFTREDRLSPSRVRTEVKDWLIENQIVKYSTGRWIGEKNKNSLLDFPHVGLSFKFQRSEDALRFKIAWGGE